ncbi:MAG: hypothetical protein RLZZ488_2853 [Pseudomonadota bacterium]
MKSVQRKTLVACASLASFLFSQFSTAAGFKSKELLSVDDGVSIPLTWLRPTKSGEQPRALVIIQHGMMRNAEKMMALANALVEKNLEVLLPDLKDSQQTDPLFPEVFVNAFEKKHADSQSHTLPSKILMAGFSAGARFLTHVAGLLYQRQRDIRGVLMLDPVVGELPEQQLGPRLPLPYFAILAKPSRCNADGSAFPLFESGRFEAQGFRLKTASHCDFEGRSSDALCYMYCGSSSRKNAEAVQLFATEWISGLVDSATPHTDYLPGGKVFTQWQQQGMFDSVFR